MNNFMYITIFIGQLSIILGATTISWSSPMVVKFNSTDNPLGRVITSSESGWLVSLSMLGEMSGCLFFGSMASKIGRKTILTSIGFPFLIFYTVMAFAEKLWLFYIARFFTGLGLGGISTILPMYSFELSDSNKRGFFGSSMLVLTNIGLLLCYALGPFVSFFTFHITMAAMAAIYIPLIFLYGQETPHFLIHKDPLIAKKTLAKLRATEDISEEFHEIQEEVKKTSRISVLDLLKTKGFSKSFIIGLGLITFMQFTGTGVVMEYNQSIFQNVGGQLAPEVYPIITGVLQLVVTMFTSTITEKYERRILLIISHTGVAMEELLFGLYFFLKDREYDLSRLSWLPLVCLISHIVLFNIGIGPLMTTVVGELFPLRVRGQAMSCMVIYMSGTGFLLAKFFNEIRNILGLGITFWMFSFSGFLGAIFVKIFVIETKGKSLQEIQNELNSENA
ncbi:hypothetical protein HHI36_018414 [Cryptolaemus montrouzieri]|uniref:Major facilitator superfamily (MFS) profile domain-containing protein n=1 Tax=Cryptolaemus montrouzieri TaxID=559131 RepID=A0ABD2P014_9CUCU